MTARQRQQLTPSFAMQQRQTGESQQPMATGLEQFLASIRFVETGSYEGDYSLVGTAVGGSRPLGAYQILDRYWASWAHQAGIPGADWRDPVAQDRVASTRAKLYFDAYGSWDLAAVAWLGGTESARKIIQRGYTGADTIQSDEIREYLASYQEATQTAPNFNRASQQARSLEPLDVQGRGGWVHPVAGPNEWSSGSWMPTTLNHRGRTHAATDIYAARGTPIVSPVSGKVISTKKSKLGGFTVRIQGDDGLIYYFAHMNEAAVVGAGQKVMAGNHLGYVGNTGSASSTSTHLHFSIRGKGGRPVNPVTFLSGVESASGAYIPPSSLGYSNAAPAKMGATATMNDMLSELSNKIAGGQRNPDILLEGVTDPAELDQAQSESVPMTASEEIDKDTFEGGPL